MTGSAAATMPTDGQTGGTPTGRTPTGVTSDGSAARARSLRFVEPLPGFLDDGEFTLAPIDPRGLLLSMRSARDPNLRFVLTPSDSFFDDYRPQLADAVADSLGAGGDGVVEVLLVLTISAGLADATANMRAPIVVASDTGRAMQVVLEDESLPMRRPLVPAG